MNLETRRKDGSPFSNADNLEVRFTSDNQLMASVVHTIEVVSGPEVTHGGGAESGEFLHYKAVERDADNDGIIDYSDVEMRVIQESKGTSIIKVVCQAVTKADADAYRVAVEEHQERYEVAMGAGEDFTLPPPDPITPTVLKTGEITLEWTEDTFV